MKMKMSPIRSAWKLLLEGRFSNLLASMLLLLLLSPFFTGFAFGAGLLQFLFLLTLGSALYSISDNKKRLTVGLVLLLFAVSAMASSYISDERRWLDLGFLVLIPFLIIITVSTLRYVLKASEVTAEKIYGALCVYLLLGFIWASAYFVMEAYLPGSLELDGRALSESVGSVEEAFSKCVYYSYVTMTTLGYGDIKPTAPATQSLAFIQALTGQLYLAVLVARLVALHIAHASRD